MLGVPGLRRGALVSAAVIVIAIVATSCGNSKPQAANPANPDDRETVSIRGVDDVKCGKAPAPSRGATAKFPASAAAALHELGALPDAGAASPSADDEAHMGGVVTDTPTASMRRADAATLRAQLRAASVASCKVLDTESAQAAGYYLGSPFLEGIGTHWIKWSGVNQRFDPARPSMLLFSAEGTRSHLVGFSYWVRSAEPPAGFAGPLDSWHRHFGLCFDASGEWADEGVTSSQCHGTHLTGRDLWMLHAWVVPGIENPQGVFAPMLRTLCHRNVPDIARCPSGHVVP